MKEVNLSQKIILISIIMLVIGFIACIALDQFYLNQWNFKKYIWMLIIAVLLLNAHTTEVINEHY